VSDVTRAFAGYRCGCSWLGKDIHDAPAKCSTHDSHAIEPRSGGVAEWTECDESISLGMGAP
jgi:hypothetical protein